MKKLLGLAVSILLAEGVGFLSGLLGMSGNAYYDELVKPSFSPPAWVFPVVWIILYALMGIAAYIIWKEGKEGANVKKALVLYGIQLFLNFLWTIIFFRFNLIGLAFVEIIILLIFILFTTFEFYKINKKTGYLMIPYILWVSFAAILNLSIYLLNT